MFLQWGPTGDVSHYVPKQWDTLQAPSQGGSPIMYVSYGGQCKKGLTHADSTLCITIHDSVAQGMGLISKFCPHFSPLHLHCPHYYHHGVPTVHCFVLHYMEAGS